MEASEPEPAPRVLEVDEDDPEAEGSLPADVLHIDPMNVKSEFVRLPGYFSTYGEKAADTLREVLKAKYNVKRVEAKLYIAYREESDALKEQAGTSRGAGYSEKQLDHLVQLHPEMLLAQDRLAKAEVARARAMGDLEAVRAKRDSLVSITGHVRDERRAMGLSGGFDDEDG